MSWQDDCAASGGFATVFPYAVPLSQIFPGVPGLPPVPTVPGFPACRSMDSQGNLSYVIPPTLSTANKLSIVSDTLGDEAMAQLAGPMQAISDAAAAVTAPIATGVMLAVAAVLVVLFFSVRKRT